MNRLPIIAGTGIVVLAVLVSILVIVFPREEAAQVKPAAATSDRDFFVPAEKLRTDDGKTFKPDWD